MNVFFYCFWGKEYVDEFLKVGIPSFMKNITKIKKEDLYSSKLEIWTTKKDIKYILKNPNIKKLSKLIKINYEIIENIIETTKVIHKYEMISIFQNIFINSHSFNNKYLWFFYPDQYFTDDLISKNSNLLNKKNLDLILFPSVQVNKRKVLNFLLKKKSITNSEIKKKTIINLHAYYSNRIEIDQLNEPFGKVCGLINDQKKSIIIKDFHCHPLVFNVQRNYKSFINPFYPSIDEGIPNDFTDKNVFKVNSDKFGLIGSVAKKDIYPSYKNKHYDIYHHAILTFNKLHIKFSNITHIIGSRSRSFKFKEKLNKINKLFFKVINTYKYFFNNFKNLDLLNNLNTTNKYNKSINYTDIIEKILLEEKKYQNFLNYDIINLNKIIFSHLLLNINLNKKKKLKLFKKLILNLKKKNNNNTNKLIFLQKIYEKNL